MPKPTYWYLAGKETEMKMSPWEVVEVRVLVGMPTE
jgi:hypothetical protein